MINKKFIKYKLLFLFFFFLFIVANLFYFFVNYHLIKTFFEEQNKIVGFSKNVFLTLKLQENVFMNNAIHDYLYLSFLFYVFIIAISFFILKKIFNDFIKYEKKISLLSYKIEYDEITNFIRKNTFYNSYKEYYLIVLHIKYFFDKKKGLMLLSNIIKKYFYSLNINFYPIIESENTLFILIPNDKSLDIKKIVKDFKDALEQQTNNVFIKVLFKIGILFFSNIDINKALEIAHYLIINQKEELQFYDNVDINSLEYSIKQKEKLFNEIKNRDFKNFELYFHPQVNKKGKIVSAEALIRWQYAGKIITPFIICSFLEENPKLYIELEKWIIENTIKTIKELNIPISCNLTEIFLLDNKIIDFIKDTLNKYKIENKNFIIELLETNSFFDEKIVNNLNSLKEIGVGIALDDFGKGYSNIDRLLNIPFDKIKIDRFIIKQILENKDLEFLKNFISFIKMFSKEIVIEGVENKEYYEIIIQTDIDYLQGFYFYKPLNLETFKKELKK